MNQILAVVAVILLALQALGVSAPRVSLGWAGLTLWAVVALLL